MKPPEMIRERFPSSLSYLMVSTEVDHSDIGEAADTEDYSAVSHVTVSEAETRSLENKKVG